MSDELEEFNSSPLREATVQLHELFEELKRAGFSRKESLVLVGRVLSSSITEGMGDLPE